MNWFFLKAIAFLSLNFDSELCVYTPFDG